MAADAPDSLQAIVSAIWDLRDHAYDHPQLWESVSAESVFQAMGESMQRAIDSGGEVDWGRLSTAVQEALLRGPTDT
jgi:hypothetical protein